MRPERETDGLPISSAEVKNNLSFLSQITSWHSTWKTLLLSFLE
jgi:hypothetical protein